MPGQPNVEPIPLARLHPAPWNPRTIKDERFQNLCASIQADPDFLWRRPVLAQADGTIYAGNMRFRAAEHLGHETAPAIVEDIPDQLAKERALRDNAQWGEWDDEELSILLRGLEAEQSALDLLGLEAAELDRLLRLTTSAGATDPDEAPDLPDEPATRPGDLWLMGDHRLLCGDVTDLSWPPVLMDGAQAAVLWTDPPYGVDYEGQTAEHLKIAGDTSAGLPGLLISAFAGASTALLPGAPFYIAHPSGRQHPVFWLAIEAAGWQIHQELLWVKDSMVLGHSDYHNRHECIIYGWLPGPGRSGRGNHVGSRWYGGNDRTSVFEIPRPKASRDHPTSKPVALVEAMVSNSSQRGDIVLDPFLGSGSTLIACERLGRRCFALEIDPRYVDVAVKRWEQYTGQKAERVKAEDAE